MNNVWTNDENKFIKNNSHRLTDEQINAYVQYISNISPSKELISKIVW